MENGVCIEFIGPKFEWMNEWVCAWDWLKFLVWFGLDKGMNESIDVVLKVCSDAICSFKKTSGLILQAKKSITNENIKENF